MFQWIGMFSYEHKPMCRTCCLSCPMCLGIEKSICRRQGNHDDQSVGSFCWLHYGHSSRWPECRIHLNKQRLKMWFWVRSKFKYLPQTLIFLKVNDFSITSVKQHKKCLDDTFERFFTSSKNPQCLKITQNIAFDFLDFHQFLSY